MTKSNCNRNSNHLARFFCTTNGSNFIRGARGDDKTHGFMYTHARAHTHVRTCARAHAHNHTHIIYWNSYVVSKDCCKRAQIGERASAIPQGVPLRRDVMEAAARSVCECSARDPTRRRGCMRVCDGLRTLRKLRRWPRSGGRAEVCGRARSHDGRRPSVRAAAPPRRMCVCTRSRRGEQIKMCV